MYRSTLFICKFILKQKLWFRLRKKNTTQRLKIRYKHNVNDAGSTFLQWPLEERGMHLLSSWIFNVWYITSVYLKVMILSLFFFSLRLVVLASHLWTAGNPDLYRPVGPVLVLCESGILLHLLVQVDLL